MKAIFMAVAIVFATSFPAHANEAVSFQLDKMADACGVAASDNAQYRKCLSAEVAQATAKMKGDILCSVRTCLIRLACSPSGDSCSNNGFRVQYGSDPYGHTIEITLSSGKIANYFRCGTCSAVEPASDDEIPLRLMESAKSVLLEIPALERGK